jgi:hypothetical protein
VTRVDLDAVAEYVQERVWRVYEAAEDWQAANEHTCDPRCAAVEEIPDLTSDMSVLVSELRLHDLAVRELLEWARRSHGGDPALRSEEFYRATELAQRVLDGEEAPGD